VALIAMHSFTPVFKGAARPWHAGVLYNRDPRFAHIVMAPLKREKELVVGDNEPASGRRPTADCGRTASRGPSLSPHLPRPKRRALDYPGSR
jgi:predicted N-formylglutamate amidohydrolase